MKIVEVSWESAVYRVAPMTVDQSEEMSQAGAAKPNAGNRVMVFYGLKNAGQLFPENYSGWQPYKLEDMGFCPWPLFRALLPAALEANELKPATQGEAKAEAGS